MKKIRRFRDFKTNEGVLDNIARLNPERYENDKKFSNLIDDIKEDFEKYDKDLRKVKIIDDGGTSISLDNISIGKSYSLSYVFGKYHPVLRDVLSGNRENGDRRIKLSKVPFSFTIRKDELEKAFNTGRINPGRCRVVDTKTVPNYDRNPNIGNHRRHNEVVDEYKISSDMSNYIFTYFIDEYDRQYPELKGTRYKSSWDIRDIKKGVPVTTKFITVKNKEGKNLTLELRKGDNEKELRKKVSNMTEEEYDAFYKKKRNEIYADSDKKQKEEEKATHEKVANTIKDLGINLPSSQWEPNGFSLRYYGYGMSISFSTEDATIINKIKNIKDKKIDGFEFKDIHIKDGYLDAKRKYVEITYEALEY